MIARWESALSDDLKAEWQALQRRAGAAPFHTLEWHLAWLRHFPTRNVAYLCAGEGELRAIWPLYRGPASIRTLGAGVADYLGPLAAPEDLGDVLEAFAPLLDRAVCDLPHLDAVDEARVLATRLQDRGLWVGVVEQERCPRLSLAGGWEAVEARLSRGMRQRLRYAQRRLLGMGGMEAAVVAKEDVPGALARMMEWHQRRFRRRLTPGSFAGRRRAFHLDVAERLAEAGSLRLVELRLGGRAIAALYAMRGGRSWFYYGSGFSARFSRLSPGLVLLKESIRLAAQEGAAEFDFLRGEESYKQPWASGNRTLARVAAVRGLLRPYLRSVAWDEHLRRMARSYFTK